MNVHLVSLQTIIVSILNSFPVAHGECVCCVAYLLRRRRSLDQKYLYAGVAAAALLSGGGAQAGTLSDFYKGSAKSTANELSDSKDYLATSIASNPTGILYIDTTTTINNTLSYFNNVAFGGALNSSWSLDLSSSPESLFRSNNPIDNGFDTYANELNPFWGNINPFWGNINPFYGNISPFWGNISPFWGNINPFWGNINAWWGDISPFWGNVSPFWGNINAFWGDVGPQWGNINAWWGNISPFSEYTYSDYVTLQGMLVDFYNTSEDTWGERILEQTGQDFYSGFAAEVFGKYGIDLNDPSSLDGWSAADRSMFFLDWYDGLMNFSGMDRVDHWMGTVKWSPALTQDHAGEGNVKIGLLDGQIHGDRDLMDNVKNAFGYKNNSGGHGAAVASLIASAHDGQGVMGIAPNAQIVNYNPFDDTGTADWSDIVRGINLLTAQGASVVNMSLGVPDSTLHSHWANILSNRAIAEKSSEVVFVKAAGNDGHTQTQNVEWTNKAAGEHLIVVGSVDPNKQISSFSNRPGDACLLTLGVCLEENKLKYKFIVAPGELILTSDDNGGVVRRTGTSFAAPIVSGTIALMQDRWPWLSRHASETVSIIFQTAEDLGDPGVDDVYGWGLLDVEAALSPINFDSLEVYQNSQDGRSSNDWATTDLKSLALDSSMMNYLDAAGKYIYAIEEIGETHRDFAIPLGDVMAGQSVATDDGKIKAARHLTRRLNDWAQSGVKLNGARHFGDIHSGALPLANLGGWNLAMTAMSFDPADGAAADGDLPYAVGFAGRNEPTGLSFLMGDGNGQAMLNRQKGFGFHSDYDVETGGVNPILGFASGGAYARIGLDVSKKGQIGFAFTEHSDDHSSVDPVTGQIVTPLNGFDNYKAAAMVFDYAHKVSDKLNVSLGYTQLTEETGLLGAQGQGALNLSGGALTDAFTIGADAALPNGVSLAASATTAKTQSTGFDNSALEVGAEGITATSFELAGEKAGVFRKKDAMRVSLTQPLHVEDGSLTYKSVQVVDRQTGELGEVADSWSLDGNDRKLLAEMLYATPLLSGAADISLFGRMNVAGSGSQESELTFGSRAKLKF